MGESREALRRWKWLSKTNENAKALLQSLMSSSYDQETKEFLNRLKSKYFTQDLAMLIHNLNIVLADREKK